MAESKFLCAGCGERFKSFAAAERHKHERGATRLVSLSTRKDPIVTRDQCVQKAEEWLLDIERAEDRIGPAAIAASAAAACAWIELAKLADG